MKESTASNNLFFSRTENRLRSGWRLLLQFLLLAFTAVLFSIPALILLPFIGEASTDVTLLANSLVLAFAITVSVYIARRFLDRRSFANLGLSLNSLAVRDLLFGTGLAGLMMALIFVIELAMGWLRFDGFAWQVQPPLVILLGLLGAVAAFLLTSWGEELLFRGYWLRNLAEGLNIDWAVIISSLIFAAVHLVNPNPSWMAMVGLVLAGFFFAFSYIRSRFLWLPIGLHFGWNFFEGTVFGFQVSGLEIFRLIQQTATGPELITGGLFGPEAGLILLPALIFGAAIIYWYTQDRHLKQKV